MHEMCMIVRTYVHIITASKDRLWIFDDWDLVCHARMYLHINARIYLHMNARMYLHMLARMYLHMLARTYLQIRYSENAPAGTNAVFEWRLQAERESAQGLSDEQVQLVAVTVAVRMLCVCVWLSYSLTSIINQTNTYAHTTHTPHTCTHTHTYLYILMCSLMYLAHFLLRLRTS